MHECPEDRPRRPAGARAADGSRPRGRGDREFIYLRGPRLPKLQRVTRARAATSTEQRRSSKKLRVVLRVLPPEIDSGHPQGTG